MEFLIELLKVVIIGIVEGITEWLPVSSTGHMILVEEFLHLNVTAEFQEMFNPSPFSAVTQVWLCPGVPLAACVFLWISCIWQVL